MIGSRLLDFLIIESLQDLHNKILLYLKKRTSCWHCYLHIYEVHCGQYGHKQVVWHTTCAS